MRAKEIMKTNVITVREDDSLQEVARILVENGISGVPVINEDRIVVGIITEGDLIYQGKKFDIPPFIEILGGVFYFEEPRKLEKELKKIVATRAVDVMSTKVITVEENTSIEDIASMMIDESINRVPVVAGDGKLLGIVSRQDLIRHIHEKN